MTKALVAAVLALALAACSSEPEPPAAPGTPPYPELQQPAPAPGTPPYPELQQPAAGAPTPQPGAAPNPLALLGALAQGAAGSPPAAPVKLIPRTELAQALPTGAAGWTLEGEPESAETNLMGIQVSQAKCTLVQGAMRARVEIIDTSFNGILTMGFNMARTVAIDSHAERQGPINFGPHPGLQKFDKAGNAASINVLVGNRLLVNVEVAAAGSEAPAIALTQNVKLDALAGLAERK